MAKKKATKKKATRTKKKTTKKKSTPKSRATKKKTTKKKVVQRASARDKADLEAPEYEGWRDFSTRQRQAIKAFEHMPIPAKMCEEIGLSRGTFYTWMREKPLFQEAIERAAEISVSNVEAVAMKLGVHGTDELQISNGQVVMSAYDETGNLHGIDEKGEPILKPVVRRVYDTGMLKTILAAKLPEYGKKRIEHTGKDGAEIKQQSSILILGEKDLAGLPPEIVEQAANQMEDAV